MFRAERTITGRVMEGHYFKSHGKHYILPETLFAAIYSYSEEYEIKPETLEIYLFGEWRPVSELETKYTLVEKGTHCPHRESCVDYRSAQRSL